MAYANIIGGGQLEATAATHWNQLEEAYKAKWGAYLSVTSALRTYAEQERLYNGWINRLPGFYLAAKPGTSLHEKGLSVDVAAPANVDGHPQHEWLETEGPKFGFKWTGKNFSPREPWHFDYVGGGSAGSPAFSQDVLNRQNFLNATFKAGLVPDGLNGTKTKAAIKAYQIVLGFTGSAVDGIWGSKTEAAHKAYVAAHASAPAATGGAKTADFGRVDVVQRALKTKYPLYAGKLVVDNTDGPATKAAVKEFQRRAGLVVDGIAGSATRKALGV